MNIIHPIGCTIKICKRKVPQRSSVCVICSGTFIAGQFWQSRQRKAVWQKVCGRTCRTALKKSVFGKAHWLWKGDDVCYSAVHSWIRKHFPPPDFCQKCRKKGNVDAANISGKYKRKISDWLYLCHSCHVKFDDHLHKRGEDGRFIVCTLKKLSTTTRLIDWNPREVGRIAKVESRSRYVIDALGWK